MHEHFDGRVLERIPQGVAGVEGKRINDMGGAGRADLEQAQPVGVPMEARRLAIQGEPGLGCEGPAQQRELGRVIDEGEGHAGGWSLPARIRGGPPHADDGAIGAFYSGGGRPFRHLAVTRGRGELDRLRRYHTRDFMLRTKMVCTLGPASSSPEVIGALVAAGLNVARMNMSHGSQETHARNIDLVREAARVAGRPVAVLADLAGPKIRVGELPGPVALARGDRVVLVPEGVDPASADEIPTTYGALAQDLKPGNHVLVDDGLIELEVVGSRDDRVTLTVVRGGALQSRKGINLPGVAVRAASLTPKDESDLEFALAAGVEYVGLSFVRRPADVTLLKEKVKGRALVVAKIEKASALAAIEEILSETDAVMVARGDLGVELPFEQVPLAQKKIIQLANFYGRSGDHRDPDARFDDRPSAANSGGGVRRGQRGAGRY